MIRGKRRYRHDTQRYRRPQWMVGIYSFIVVIVVATVLLVWQHESAALFPSQTGTTITRLLHFGRTSDTANTASDTQAFGIAAGSSLPPLSQQDLSTRMAGIAAAGAKWIRFDFDWSQIQSQNSTTYNWTTYDRIVAAATANHLHILGIIDYTPAWAAASGCTSSKCPPVDPNTYAHFASVLAKRYAPQGIHNWEIWNEPNNPQFWQPGANPQAYVAMLKAAYTSLHATDGHAYIITAGLSPQPNNATAMSPVNFLSAMYNNGAQSFFDAVGDHPYTFPLTPTSNADDAWTQMAAPTNSLRSVMIAHGDTNKKIWITEFGAPTDGPGPVATLTNPNLAAQPYVVDQALQAKILTDAIAQYKTYSWAGPFFYYTYQDSGTDPSTNENFFGLLTADGTKKQAYSVFQQAAASIHN